MKIFRPYVTSWLSAPWSYIKWLSVTFLQPLQSSIIYLISGTFPEYFMDWFLLPQKGIVFRVTFHVLNLSFNSSRWLEKNTKRYFLFLTLSLLCIGKNRQLHICYVTVVFCSHPYVMQLPIVCTVYGSIFPLAVNKLRTEWRNP